MISPKYSEWLEDNNLAASPDKPAKWIWIDLETTNLYPWTGVILEVGVMFTDEDLNVVGKPVHFFVEHDVPYEDLPMPQFVYDMHTKSGLLDRKSRPETSIFTEDTLSLAEISDALISIADNRSGGQAHKLVVAGSSIGFDRAWMARYLPRLQETLDYHSVDVSSIREVAKQESPAIESQIAVMSAPRKIHRSIPDIVDSIYLYSLYRDSLIYS